MQVQLGGDGADRPVIGVVSAQDFCFSFGGKSHRCSCSVGNDELDSAGSLAVPRPAVGDGSGRSARTRVSPARSVRPSVNQRPATAGNPDASLSATEGSTAPFGPDSDAAVRRVDGVLVGWPGNAARRLVPRVAGPRARSPRRNSGGRDHSDCKSSPPCDNARTGSAFQECPWALRAHGSRWQRPLRDILCVQRRLLATGATPVLAWRLGPGSRQHLHRPVCFLPHLRKACRATLARQSDRFAIIPPGAPRALSKPFENTFGCAPPPSTPYFYGFKAPLTTGICPGRGGRRRNAGAHTA